jgi:hypothetical protein
MDNPSLPLPDLNEQDKQAIHEMSKSLAAAKTRTSLASFLKNGHGRRQ